MITRYDDALKCNLTQHLNPTGVPGGWMCEIDFIYNTKLCTTENDIILSDSAFQKNPNIVKDIQNQFKYAEECRTRVYYLHEDNSIIQLL